MSNRVQTSNPFDLLSDDPRPVAAPPKPAAAATKQPATTKPAAPATQQKESKTNNAVQKTGDQKDQRQSPRPQGGQQAKRAPGQRPSNVGGSVVSDDVNLTEKDKSARPRGEPRRDRGRDRPARGRAYDRRSGTGRPANESKREDAGRANWGNEIEAQTEALATDETQVEKEEKEGAAPATEGENETTPSTEEPPKEVEKETFGLEEYLAKLKEKAPKVDALKPRTVDGSDLETSGFAVFKREEDESIVKKKEKKEKKEQKEPVQPKEKVISADQLLNFSAPRSDDGGRRGGRGGGRGGRGRGEGRRGDRKPSGGDRGRGSSKSAAGQSESFQISESAFPSLGGSGGVAPTKA